MGENDTMTPDDATGFGAGMTAVRHEMTETARGQGGGLFASAPGACLRVALASDHRGAMRESTLAPEIYPDKTFEID